MNSMVMFMYAAVSETSGVIYYPVVNGLSNTGRVAARLTSFISNASLRSIISGLFPYIRGRMSHA